MIDFFRDHYKIMLIGFFGVMLGVFLNWYFGNYSNKKLLGVLNKELQNLKDKQEIQPLTEDEEDKMNYLKGEIYILEFKCK